ncbi:putative prophage transcriptional repressor [Acinetobacter baumannii NCGM 237]|nr:putative prophage transcriptional repressor [Acinetobacter baumannii NCGM 237]
MACIWHGRDFNQAREINLNNWISKSSKRNTTLVIVMKLFYFQQLSKNRLSHHLSVGFLLRLTPRWAWMAISQIMGYEGNAGDGLCFQLTQQDQEPMALKALATQCFQQFVMAGMLYATLMQSLCRMSLFRCA